MGTVDLTPINVSLEKNISPSWKDASLGFPELLVKTLGSRDFMWVSLEMGTARYVVDVTRGWFIPSLLPVLIFLISAFISFATGTSWGTYAIVIPIAVPMAFEFSQGQVSSLVLATVAAVAGGGVFGDHCSPLSDTTVLSSLGSACDHMDHVRTQLPYALVVAFVASIIYLILPFVH